MSRVLILVLALVLVGGAVVVAFFVATQGSDNPGASQGHYPQTVLTFPTPKVKGSSPTAFPPISVIVITTSKTCWSGYVEGKSVADCGSREFKITGGSSIVGANVRKKANDNTRVELRLVVDGRIVDSQATIKPLGLLDVNGAAS